MKKITLIQFTIVLLALGLLLGACGATSAPNAKPATMKRLVRFTNTWRTFIDNDVDTMYHVGDTMYYSNTITGVVIVR